MPKHIHAPIIITKKEMLSIFIKLFLLFTFLLTQSSTKPLDSELFETKNNSLKVSVGEEFTLRLNTSSNNKWELLNGSDKQVVEFIKSESKINKNFPNSKKIDYFIFKAMNKGAFRLVSIDSNNKKQYFDIFVE